MTAMLLNSLPAFGYDTLLVCQANDTVYPDIEHDGLRVVRIPLRGKGDLVPAFAAVRRFIRTEGIHIVNTHEFYSNLIGRLASASVGVPVVGTVHTFPGTDSGPSTARATLLKLVESLTIPLSHRLIAVSECRRRQLVAMGLPSGKIVTVRNGLTLRQPHAVALASARAELAGKKGTALVGTVGRLVPEKGMDVFLRAAATIKRSSSTVKFLMAGGGVLRSALAGLSDELGLQEDVVFAGHRADVPEIVSLLDVFVLASRSEGLPMALLEAMALGKPIVATAVGGIPEAVHDGHNGLLVPPDDPQALARAILRLLRDPELAFRLGCSARETASREFGSERMARQTAKVYDSVLGVRCRIDRCAS